jgi:hypothetical protein
MKAAQRKAQATVERTWVERCTHVDKAVIDLSRLGIVGHPATIDDELVCHLVSLWDEDRGRFKAIGLAAGAERAGLV